MNAQEQAQFRWNHVAKPLNSLGKLEQLVVQIAGIQQTADVCINKRCVLICCGDHGVVAEPIRQRGNGTRGAVHRRGHGEHQPDGIRLRNGRVRAGFRHGDARHGDGRLPHRRRNTQYGA